MYKSKANKVMVTFKVDHEKAYERVCRDFLEKVLNEFGLSPMTISLIMWCVRSSSLLLIWNGSRTDSFALTHGLRQGYLFSP